MTEAELADQLAEYQPELEGTPAAQEAMRFLLLHPPLPLSVLNLNTPLAWRGRCHDAALGPTPFKASVLAAGVTHLESSRRPNNDLHHPMGAAPDPLRPSPCEKLIGVPNTYADLEWRGSVYQTTSPDIAAKIDAGGVTAYIGFDPTADSLHVGHLMQLLNLRRLQQGGNSPIVLGGGATGMIGDPSFKSSERQLLDDSTIRNNIERISVQLQKFLDFEPGQTQARLVNNYDWTAPVEPLSFCVTSASISLSIN